MSETNCVTWSVRARRRSTNPAAICRSWRNNSASGRAGAKACTRLSLTSRNSRHLQRGRQWVAPGGKKKRLPLQALQQQRRQQLALQPGFGGLHVVFGQ